MVSASHCMYPLTPLLHCMRLACRHMRRRCGACRRSRMRRRRSRVSGGGTPGPKAAAASSPPGNMPHPQGSRQQAANNSFFQPPVALTYLCLAGRAGSGGGCGVSGSAAHAGSFGAAQSAHTAQPAPHRLVAAPAAVSGDMTSSLLRRLVTPGEVGSRPPAPPPGGMQRTRQRAQHCMQRVTGRQPECCVWTVLQW